MGYVHSEWHMSDWNHKDNLGNDIIKLFHYHYNINSTAHKHVIIHKTMYELMIGGVAV